MGWPEFDSRAGVIKQTPALPPAASRQSYSLRKATTPKNPVPLDKNLTSFIRALLSCWPAARNSCCLVGLTLLVPRAQSVCVSTRIPSTGCLGLRRPRLCGALDRRRRRAAGARATLSGPHSRQRRIETRNTKAAVSH